jgi:hypothetical protein
MSGHNEGMHGHLEDRMDRPALVRLHEEHDNKCNYITNN